MGIFITDVERATVTTIKRGVDFQSGEILKMTLSLFGGHAKCVGANTNVGRPTVRAVITSRKVLVDDCHYRKTIIVNVRLKATYFASKVHSDAMYSRDRGKTLFDSLGHSFLSDPIEIGRLI